LAHFPVRVPPRPSPHRHQVSPAEPRRKRPRPRCRHRVQAAGTFKQHGSIESNNGSTQLKLLGRTSKRDNHRQLKVLSVHGIDSKQYWQQMKEEKDLRFSLPIVRMILNRSQCRKAGCICSRGSQIIMGTMSRAQHFHICAQQCLSFTSTDTTLSLPAPVVQTILTHVMNAQPAAYMVRQERPSSESVKMRAHHDNALARYSSGKCPTAVGMNIMEAIRWNLKLLHECSTAHLMFVDEIKPGDKEAMGRGVGAAASWCTDAVMQHSKFEEMGNYTFSTTSAVLAASCFDGTRVQKDFQRPLQQHSWQFANSRSLSPNNVFLTHLGSVDEKKSTMAGLFGNVHEQLEKAEARSIVMPGQLGVRPLDFMFVCDCKANLQILSISSNSCFTPCALCTMLSAKMYETKHQRYTMHAMECKLEAEKERATSSRPNTAQIAATTSALKDLKDALGTSRTPASMALAGKQICKLIDTCSIADGIDGAFEDAKQTAGFQGAKPKFLKGILTQQADVQEACRRLASHKIIDNMIKCGGGVHAAANPAPACDSLITRLTEAICSRLKEQRTSMQALARTMLSPELALRVTTLSRAAGPVQSRDRCCGTDMCSACISVETQLWRDHRDNGVAAVVPTWVQPMNDQRMDDDFKYHDKINSLANGRMRRGEEQMTLANTHFADADNSCLDASAKEYPCQLCKPCYHADVKPFGHKVRSLLCVDCTHHMFTASHCVAASARYETFGQVGVASLKSLPNVGIAPDLLHTIMDVTGTLVRWMCRYAEGCSTLQVLADVLVEVGLKAYGWGPMRVLRVSGRLDPLRDSLNGPEGQFVRANSGYIAQRTFGKFDEAPDPPSDKYTCYCTITEGFKRLNTLCKWILCMDWPNMLQREKADCTTNPLVELQGAYEQLHTWALTDAPDLTKTSDSVQFPDTSTFYQGIAWHNLSHLVYDVAPMLWDRYGLSVGSVATCQSFEGTSSGKNTSFTHMYLD
jgi:hypothetical protein